MVYVNVATQKQHVHHVDTQGTLAENVQEQQKHGAVAVSAVEMDTKIQIVPHVVVMVKLHVQEHLLKQVTHI